MSVQKLHYMETWVLGDFSFPRKAFLLWPRKCDQNGVKIRSVSQRHRLLLFVYTSSVHTHRHPLIFLVATNNKQRVGLYTTRPAAIPTQISLFLMMDEKVRKNSCTTTTVVSKTRSVFLDNADDVRKMGVRHDRI